MWLQCLALEFSLILLPLVASKQPPQVPRPADLPRSEGAEPPGRTIWDVWAEEDRPPWGVGSSRLLPDLLTHQEDRFTAPDESQPTATSDSLKSPEEISRESQQLPF